MTDPEELLEDPVDDADVVAPGPNPYTDLEDVEEDS
jgi:hypothetical protein